MTILEFLEEQERFGWKHPFLWEDYKEFIFHFSQFLGVYVTDKKS